ncbi:MAG: tetratricopeptide repeat protein, partial [Bryobacteraceae bacterium]|nr:tetratricopeptide repeat protein [Bryobacteraceae bacterium]
MRFLWLLFAAPLGASPVCKPCHANIVAQYQATGMARTFSQAMPSAEVEALFTHDVSGQSFQVSIREKRIFQKRWPTGAPQRAFERPATYAIGSGNHARSYLHREPNGTLTQLPLSWYTQTKEWAMSPGYDRPGHAGFSRRIEPGCIFCHNSYPRTPAEFGALPRFEADLPGGIGCERCHGNGDAHVAAPSARNIINPARLPRDRSLDVCLQCHLETTSAKLPHAIRRAQRDVYSFQPGERLSDYVVQFDHPSGSGYDDKFEINSAGYRMLQSACFLKSGKLTCTTCHNPHQPAAAQDYQPACQSCHSQPHTSGDCVSCHMPKRRTSDAIHVVMTDHKIQKPPADAADLLAPRKERPEVYRGSLQLFRSPNLNPSERDLYMGQALIIGQADRPRGIQLLAEILPKMPVLEAMVELASAYVAEKQPYLALSWFRRALALRPSMPQVRYNYGLAANSKEELEKVIAAEPEFAEALNSYGALLLPSPAARPFFVRAHRAQPYLPEPLNNLGLLAQSANDLAGARSCFDQALAADPDFAPAHNNMGRLEAQEGKFSTAIPYFEKTVKLDPDYGEAHYNLGRLLQDAGETERALPHLERAVALNPRLPAAHMALGVAYGDLDRIPEAIREFEQVLHLEPGNANAHRNLQTA